MASSSNHLFIANVKPFNGVGFDSWKFRLERTLERHGVLDVISQNKPNNTADNYRDFIKNDSTAKDIIVQLVGDNVLEIIKTQETSKGMIEALKAVYEKTGLQSRVQIQKKLRNLVLKDDGNLGEFLVDFDKTLRELNDAGGKIDDSEKIITLLSAMPDKFSSVVTSIDILFRSDPSKVTVDFVKNSLMAEDDRLKTKVEVTSVPVPSHAFVGHNKYKGKGKRTFQVRCYYCHEMGHIRSKCPKRLSKNHETANMSNVENKEIAFLGSHTKQEVAVNCDSNVMNSVYLAVDSGCTNHLFMSKYIKFLTNSKSVDKQINVAKVGETVAAKFQGSFSTISKEGLSVTLNDVFVCDNLSYNLLSVRQIEEKGFRVIFENKEVKIMRGNTVIITGKLIGNLYFIELQLYSDVANIVRDTPELWHKRMGHSCRFPVSSVCEICLKGKQTRSPFLKSIPSDRKARRLLQYVSTDVCGKISPPTHDGKNYYVSFIDHYSHFGMLYLIKEKNEVETCFRNFVALTESKFNMKIEYLRCDNAGENSSKSFKDFCNSKGITIQYSVPRNPEQNGLAEKYNRTILDKSRCLILDSGLDKSFWGEAVLAAVYLTNRTPTSTLPNDCTPAEIWYGYKPDMNKIKLFGCDAYAHIPEEDRSGKFAERSRKCIFIGYCDNGYRLWDPLKRVVFTSRSVKFDETCEGESPVHVMRHRGVEEQTITEPVKIEPEVILPDNNQENKIRRSSRDRRMPSYLDDYEVGMMMALSAGCLPSEIPKNYTEAVSMGNGWKEAIDKELLAIENNGTWNLVEPKPDDVIVDSRWVFVEKNVDGQLVKRARLVARGYQQPALDNEDVYAPVARLTTLRVLLAIAVDRDMDIHQLDVKSAFLKSPVSSDVFLKPPDGLKVKPGVVCKLVKALYGLRESPKCWNTTINNHLCNLGFKRSKVDPCLYFNGKTYVLIWVDDIFVISICKDDVKSLKSNLMKILELSDLSNDTKIVFLGLEIERKDTILSVSQKNLIKKIVNRFNMVNCKISKIPMEPKLNLEKGAQADFKVPYKEVLGSLMYLMLGTRPDLCFTVSYFGRFQNNYNNNHWKHLKNVIRYLSYTNELGLIYNKLAQNDQVSVQAYADSDFASDINDRKSVSGYVILCNNKVVNWCSKKQSVVALSSSEAEYLALSACMTECLFLGQLLKEIFDFQYPIKIFEDNQGCIKMAQTYETKRSKHIDVKHHFVKDMVNKGNFVIEYVPTNKQLADVMTKALPVTQFELLRNCLNVSETNV